MSPTPEALDINFKNMERQMSENKADNLREHQEIKDLLKEVETRITTKIEEMSKNKANKWVETVVRWSLTAVMTGIIGFIGYYFWALIKLIEKV